MRFRVKMEAQTGEFYFQQNLTGEGQHVFLEPLLPVMNPLFAELRLGRRAFIKNGDVN